MSSNRPTDEILADNAFSATMAGDVLENLRNMPRSSRPGPIFRAMAYTLAAF
jgi:hypothetical protein